MTTGVVRWHGVTKRGRSTGGNASPLDLTAFVEQRFNNGWRDLRVFDNAGIEVGGISRETDNGHRTWWATR